MISKVEVVNLYPMEFRANHRKKGLRNVLNRYGLSVSPWMLPRLMGLGGVGDIVEP